MEFIWQNPEKTIDVKNSKTGESATLRVAALSLESMAQLQDIQDDMKSSQSDGKKMLELVSNQLDILFPDGWEDIKDMPFQYLAKLVEMASELSTDISDETKKKLVGVPSRKLRSTKYSGKTQRN